MTKPAITSRTTKGAALTYSELDTNFSNLQNATIAVTGDTGTITNNLNDSFKISGGTGLTSSVAGTVLTVNLDNTAVTAGSYNRANITVDAQGRITAASAGTINGTSGRITVSGTTTLTLDLATTAVTAGSYTTANITVDAYGRITSATSGSGGSNAFGTVAVSGQSNVVADQLNDTLTLVAGTGITLTTDATTDTVTISNGSPGGLAQSVETTTNQTTANNTAQTFAPSSSYRVHVYNLTSTSASFYDTAYRVNLNAIKTDYGNRHYFIFYIPQQNIPSGVLTGSTLEWRSTATASLYDAGAYPTTSYISAVDYNIAGNALLTFEVTPLPGGVWDMQPASSTTDTITAAGTFLITETSKSHGTYTRLWYYT